MALNLSGLEVKEAEENKVDDADTYQRGEPSRQLPAGMVQVLHTQNPYPSPSTDMSQIIMGERAVIRAMRAQILEGLASKVVKLWILVRTYNITWGG